MASSGRADNDVYDTICDVEPSWLDRPSQIRREQRVQQDSFDAGHRYAPIGGTVSKAGMIGMEVATHEMLSVGESLTDGQWLEPSGAEGWSVKDVVAHAGCLMSLVDAVAGAAAPDLGIEQINEVMVAEKRGLNGRDHGFGEQQSGHCVENVCAPPRRAVGVGHSAAR
jgi:hypothetical protein